MFAIRALSRGTGICGTDMDHIHLLVSLPPSAAPSVVVRTLKTQLSREVREQYTDHVRKYLYGENCPFWSSSYFIATTGSVSMETVKAYIDGQRTDAHKRKYEKTGRYKKSGSRRSRGNSSPGN
ncbi:IS200/IS605 family transposase [Ruminococcus sp. CLA-AA-H200]|uniref:IS200/IS605 family transposase n=1 Tax=Ruminococcus turbiniformis TaxID=2881258 RepID=A0ABS8G5H2_9FIRM|nr:IS200/IS605 family transposase [Ruminococcus turbiniformis]